MFLSVVIASFMEKQATVTPYLQFVNLRRPKKAKELLLAEKKSCREATKIGFLWLSLELKIKQAWALQCDPDAMKRNQNEDRNTKVQVDLYTLIFLKYWLEIWILIKDLGSVSAEDWNL